MKVYLVYKHGLPQKLEDRPTYAFDDSNTAAFARQLLCGESMEMEVLSDPEDIVKDLALGKLTEGERRALGVGEFAISQIGGRGALAEEKMTDKETLLKLARRLMRERLFMPEATVGRFQIKHEYIKAGSNLMLVRMRESMYTGLPVCDLPITSDTVIHRLVEGKKSVWMSDLPCELVQMHNELGRYARGKVLIGGLGLGILARMVSLRKSVKEIVVVEREADVIKLIGPYTQDGRVQIVQGDIHDYCSGVKRGQFDVALLDTWAGTSESDWVEEVVPLRRKLAGKCRVFCWQESVMLGQIIMGLWKAADMDTSFFGSKYQCAKYAFRMACVEKGLRPADARINSTRSLSDLSRLLAIEAENREDPDVQDMARLFAHYVGSAAWERTFGKYWDEKWNQPDLPDPDGPEIRVCHMRT